MFVSVRIIGDESWFSNSNLSCWFQYLEFLDKVTVLWNAVKWDSLVVRIPQCVNTDGNTVLI